MAKRARLAGAHGRPVSRDPDPNKMCWGTALSMTGRKLRSTTCGGRDIYRCDNHPGSGLLGNNWPSVGARQAAGQNPEQRAEAFLWLDIAGACARRIPLSHPTPWPACAGSSACRHAHMLRGPSQQPGPGPWASLLAASLPPDRC